VLRSKQLGAKADHFFLRFERAALHTQHQLRLNVRLHQRGARALLVVLRARLRAQARNALVAHQPTQHRVTHNLARAWTPRWIHVQKYLD